MSSRKRITRKKGRCKNVKKHNQLKGKLSFSLLRNTTETVHKKLLENPGVFKMCSSVNPTTPSTMLGTEKRMTHESSNNSNKNEEIVCLGTLNVAKLTDTVNKKRKREGDSSVEIIYEIIPKKSKLQTNITSGDKVNIHKSDLLNVHMPRVTSDQEEMDTINIDDPVLVCEIDDDDDDEVIVIDDTAATTRIVSPNTDSKLCSSKGRKVLTVPNIIPHYNNNLLDFIPLDNSTPKPDLKKQCTASLTRKKISRKIKKQRKHLIGTEVNVQVPSTATNVNLETDSSGNKVNPTSTSSPASKFGNNFYNPNHKNIKKTGLRPIIIDGSNVAMGHTSGKFFSWKGLIICINYFLKLGHLVRAIVPRFRKGACTPDLIQQVESFEDSGNVVFTPSRRVEGRLIVSYDDRYIVQCAAELGGVIVSTDNYNDLLQENQSWKETIEKRLLMFTWIGDMLMFPQDPLGKFGPSLEEFLRFR